MRYFYEKPPIYTNTKGITYECNHPVYNFCTLYLKDEKGLAVIQQRIGTGKRTFWGPIDPWLVDQIYHHPLFEGLFDIHSGNGPVYPTMTIRQVMYYLKMKPMRREPWETSFDRNLI